MRAVEGNYFVVSLMVRKQNWWGNAYLVKVVFKVDKREYLISWRRSKWFVSSASDEVLSLQVLSEVSRRKEENCQGKA